MRPILFALTYLFLFVRTVAAVPDSHDSTATVDTLAPSESTVVHDGTEAASAGEDTAVEAVGALPVDSASDSGGASATVDSRRIDTAAGIVPVESPRIESSESVWRRLWTAMAGRGIVRAMRRYAFRLGILLLSIATIAAAVLFVLQKAESRRFMTTTRLAIMDKEVQRTCRYIEKHFDDPDLSPDSICADLVTGPAFLEALFEEELGMSVNDFIAQVRINRAKHMLNKAPDSPIGDLAAQTGFGDRGDFHATFVRIAGVNVEEYRDSVRTGTLHGSTG
jgi:AraC-like DNA-binding protein